MTKICWRNRFDSAALGGGSEIATLPRTNLQHAHVAKKWHSNATTSDHIVADLGSSISIRVIAAIGMNLSSSGTVTVKASNTDSTGAAGEVHDSGALSVTANYSALYHVMSSNKAARYWRIEFVDATLSNIRVGRIFIGPAWTPTRGMRLGWQVGWNDPSRHARSHGGQVSIDSRDKFRTMRFTIGAIDEAEAYGNPFELARANGSVTDVLVIPDEDSTYITEQSVWGLLTRTITVAQHANKAYRTRYTIEERL